MKYQIIKPEVLNIRKATWYAMRNRWSFWFFVVGGVSLLVQFLYSSLRGVGSSNGGGEALEMVAVLAFLLGSVFLAYFGYVYSKIRSAFWKEVAALNHWVYTSKIPEIPQEGVIFQRGRNRRIEHHFSGVINGDRQFELFQYSFVTGPDDKPRTHNFSIITFTFKGQFPHIYLNNKRDWYGVDDGETLPLPQEFEKKFSLHAPRKYEIEALAIFTPDVLLKILEIGLVYDVEFVGQKMLICIEGSVNTIEKLEQELSIALEVEDLFDEKLDTFKFNKIGDLSYTLD